MYKRAVAMAQVQDFNACMKVVIAPWLGTFMEAKADR